MTNGKIVDSSIWVNYLNNKTDKNNPLLSDLLDSSSITMVPVVMQEVLQGIKDDTLYSLIKNMFLGFNQLIYDNTEAALDAALLYRFLRKKGVTIRKPNDCLIAWFCINFNLDLFHNDKDFENIAKYTTLKIYK